MVETAMDIPELATDRLRLRAFVEADLDAYAAMSADAEVMRYIGEGLPVGRDIAWRQMAAFLGHWMLRGYGMWALEQRSSGRLIGRVGFINPEGWPGLEIGWLLERPSWGQGLALEASRAALHWGRQESGLHGLISLIRPDNLPSERLALRLGAHLEGQVTMMGSVANLFRHA